MALNGRLSASRTQITATINKTDGRLSSVAPVTLRNQQLEITEVDDLDNVVVSELSDNATLVYNANTNLFEIKQLPVDITASQLDGGSF
jgi:hypothetical protein